jgi:hypothetical protein
MKKSTITPKMLKAIAICALLVFGVTGTAAARKATPPSVATVTWSGNGTTLTEGSRTLNTETCDADSTPYLLWILAGSKATSATITINGGDPVQMVQPGINKKTGISTFKYLMPGTIDLDTAIVTASYNDAKNKATLTISHGCTGEAGAELTVVFTGELAESYTTLGGYYNVANITISVCETAVPTNCVTFNKGASPGANGTITMSAPGTLTVNQTGESCATLLFDTALTTNQVAAVLLEGAEPNPSAFAALPDNTGETKASYSNGDTVYAISVAFLC